MVIEKIKSIGKGNSCNTFDVTMSNHSGTHIDAPNHFFESGRAIIDYSLEELIFTKPLIVDCPKEERDFITTSELAEEMSSNQNVDLLLIRTGFYRYRQADVSKYTERNPCLKPDAAQWLRNSLPYLRAIGIDCISIASFSHRSIGKDIHKILLDNNNGRSILIIEDLWLTHEINRLDKVIVSPLFIEGVDSSPCTVTGIIND